jgi:hypothetical protein
VFLFGSSGFLLPAHYSLCFPPPRRPRPHHTGHPGVLCGADHRVLHVGACERPRPAPGPHAFRVIAAEERPRAPPQAREPTDGDGTSRSLVARAARVPHLSPTPIVPALAQVTVSAYVVFFGLLMTCLECNISNRESLCPPQKMGPPHTHTPPHLPFLPPLFLQSRPSSTATSASCSPSSAARSSSSSARPWPSPWPTGSGTSWAPRPCVSLKMAVRGQCVCRRREGQVFSARPPYLPSLSFPSFLFVALQ